MKIKCIGEHRYKDQIFEKNQIYNVDESLAEHLLRTEDFKKYVTTKPHRQVETASLDESTLETRKPQAKKKSL